MLSLRLRTKRCSNKSKPARASLNPKGKTHDASNALYHSIIFVFHMKRETQKVGRDARGTTGLEYHLGFRRGRPEQCAEWFTRPSHERGGESPSITGAEPPLVPNGMLAIATKTVQATFQERAFPFPSPISPSQLPPVGYIHHGFPILYIILLSPLSHPSQTHGVLAKCTM